MNIPHRSLELCVRKQGMAKTDRTTYVQTPVTLICCGFMYNVLYSKSAANPEEIKSI